MDFVCPRTGYTKDNRGTPQACSLSIKKKEGEMDKPKPNSAFEGWIMAKIEGLEELFGNHLKHHEALERKIYILVGFGFVAGWIVSMFLK